MIRLCPISEENMPTLSEINRESALEFRFHGDVFRETGMLARSGRRVLAFGYLLVGPSYRARKAYPAGPFYVHLVLHADYRTPAGIDATERLLSALIEKFEQMKAEDPALPLVLRLWCKTSEEALLAFYEAYGFTVRDRMRTMVRPLSEELRENAENPAVTEADLSDRASMQAYIEGTGEAYLIPDSEAEMRFRLTYCGARVFTLSGRSFVTVWPREGGTFSTENVFTKKAFRRQGNAEALLNETARRLQKEGASSVTLNVYEWDKEAISLYEKIGYQTVHELSELGLS